MPLPCLGWRKRKRDEHTLSYADALAKTDSDSIEATVRKRRILFAGLVARMGVRVAQRGKRRVGWCAWRKPCAAGVVTRTADRDS